MRAERLVLSLPRYHGEEFSSSPFDDVDGESSVASVSWVTDLRNSSGRLRRGAASGEHDFGSERVGHWSA